MPASDRRFARRLIMKVPLRFRPLNGVRVPEQTAETMNICNRGVYFATDLKVSKGLWLEVHLKMPAEVIGGAANEWRFTGKVVHVEPLGPSQEKSGVGVQFVHYEAD